MQNPALVDCNWSIELAPLDPSTPPLLQIIFDAFFSPPLLQIIFDAFLFAYVGSM
jgi:hypothetical protein